MEELAKIIMIVSKHTGYDTLHLMHSKGRQYAHARNILCHIVHSDFPHLTNDLVSMMNVAKFDILKADANISAQSSRNPKLLSKISEIRQDLELPKLDISKEREEIPASVRIFGFRWTEEDERMQRKAIEEAEIYMKKLCSIGRQPIPDGMVFPKKTEPTKKKRSWYNKEDNSHYNK